MLNAGFQGGLTAFRPPADDEIDGELWTIDLRLDNLDTGLRGFPFPKW